MTNCHVHHLISIKLHRAPPKCTSAQNYYCEPWFVVNHWMTIFCVRALVHHLSMFAVHNVGSTNPASYGVGQLDTINFRPCDLMFLLIPTCISYTLRKFWWYNKASFGELVTLEILGKHQQGYGAPSVSLGKGCTKCQGSKVYLVVSSKFYESVQRYLFRQHV